MPKVSVDYIPTYAKHASGQAVVRISGRDHYLGPYGTAEAKTAYDRLIGEWLARGRQLPQRDHALTVNEIILAYWRHCELHYRKADGTSTSELNLIKLALRPLKDLYGTAPAADFGPLSLKAVRQTWIDGGVSRGVINAHSGRVKRAFKWAVENELVPPSVFHGLLAVRGLQRGRTAARETKPIRPVPEVHINAIRPFVSRQVEAMIDLQLLTAMRPGEVAIMRPCDLDVSGRIWVYRPESHKTEHHGHVREVYIGPKAQEVIKPFLGTDLQAYLFSAAGAQEERFREMRLRRKSRVQPSQLNRRVKAPKKHAREHYDVSSYRRAIKYGCIAADRAAHRERPETPPDEIIVPPWNPHRLRHNAATRLRKEHGVELARIILGHATAFTTEIYAEADKVQAMEVIGRVG